MFISLWNELFPTIYTLWAIKNDVTFTFVCLVHGNPLPVHNWRLLTGMGTSAHRMHKEHENALTTTNTFTKPRKTAWYWKRYKFCIKWHRYSTILVLVPILPFNDYLVQRLYSGQWPLKLCTCRHWTLWDKLQYKMGFFEDHTWSDWPSWPHQPEVQGRPSPGVAIPGNHNHIIIINKCYSAQ